VYGPAQAAIGKAIMDSVEAGILPEVEELLMIANVFVHPSASRRKRIHINNYKAMRNAIRHAMEGTPTVADALEHARSARHPFRDEI
jgi:formaldehyde-activating enzyme